jgi:DNA-binding Lrp family transcriptional regulator
LDRVDFRLLAELHRDALQSTRSLARAAKVTAPAAHARLRRLEEQGILRGFAAYLDPSVFGKEESIVRFAGPHGRDACLRAVRERDVVLVAHKVDRGVTTLVWLDAATDVVDRLARAFDAKPSFQTRTPARTVPELSPLDWRVLRACIDAPKHKAADLAERAGLSPRTAVRRRDALIASRVLSIKPNTGLFSGGGDVVYTLGLFGTVPFAEARRILGDCMVLNSFDRPPSRYLLGRADDLSEAIRRTDELRAHPGVTGVELALNREMWFNTDTLRHAVDAKLKAWGRAVKG